MIPSSKYKKNVELMDMFVKYGYTQQFCREFADFYVDNAKKPEQADIINAAAFYCNAGDLNNAEHYLDMIETKKLSSSEKFEYGCTALSIYGKAGDWRSGIVFRDEHVSFLEKYACKQKDPEYSVKLYIALALVDCAAKKYPQAFRLLNFGYKPQPKNDPLFMLILITATYIYARMGDEKNLMTAARNAYVYLEKFNQFEYSWTRDYFMEKIDSAKKGEV